MNEHAKTTCIKCGKWVGTGMVAGACPECASKCVNMHDELVEALQDLMDRLDRHFGGNPNADWKEQEVARDLLAKCEEKSKSQSRDKCCLSCADLGKCHETIGTKECHFGWGEYCKQPVEVEEGCKSRDCWKCEVKP